MTTRLANPAPRFFTNTNPALPLSGGKMFFFEPGTLTPKDTYSDNALSIPNANPVILDASGLLPNVFLDGAYRVVLAPSTLDNSVVFDGTYTPSQIVWDRDDVNSITTPFSSWVPNFEYGEGGNNIVIGSDGNYYVSLVDHNTGSDPVTSPGEWQMVHFFSGGEAAYANLTSFAAISPVDQASLIGDGSAWSSKLLAEILPNYLGGLGTSNNAADADHDIDIAAGVCADSTNTRMLTLGPMTKRIDATWAAGSGNGGLADGASLDPDTTYHIFAVEIGSAFDIMFDSDVDCANGAANNGVMAFRRIASLMTDSSSNILPYFQDGDTFELAAMVQDVNLLDPGELAITAKLSVPTGISVIAKVRGSMSLSTGTQNGYLLLSALVAPDLEPGLSSYQGFLRGTFASSILCYVLTDDDSQIRCRMTADPGDTTNFTLQINTEGWIDRRGA